MKCPVHQCNVLDGYSSFLLAVVDVVRSRRTAAEPELIEFSLMALCALKRQLLVNDLLHAVFCIHRILSPTYTLYAHLCLRGTAVYCYPNTQYSYSCAVTRDTNTSTYSYDSNSFE